MFDARQRTFDLDDFSAVADPDSLGRADNAPARARYRRFLSSAIRYLPPKQSEVIFLYFLDGLKMPEIALRLGVSRSTVSRRLSSAKERLRGLARLCENAGLFPS